MKKILITAFMFVSVFALFAQPEISVSGIRCWPLKEHVEIAKMADEKTELHLLKGSLILEKLLDIQPYFCFTGTLYSGIYSLEMNVLSSKDAKIQLRVQKNVRPWDNYAPLSVWILEAGKEKNVSVTFRVEKEEQGEFRIPGIRFANVEKGARIIFSKPVIRKIK